MGAGLFFYPKWKQQGNEATISWDVSGYYMYLPAIFIYKDIKQCRFHDTILKKYNPTPDFQQAFRHEPSGNYVMKYSIGQALTMLPWFAIAHFWASSSASYPADGFSYPYQVCIGFGLLLYPLIGFYFLRKILLLYFKEKTIAIVLIIFLIGTNLINYVSVDQAMTHSNLFTLYACILYLSHKYWLTYDIRKAILLGLLCGLAALIRPTDIISLFIPLLWDIDSITKLKQRFKFVFKNLRHLLLMALSFACIIFIQPMYWKYVSGEWVVYSYQDQGFSWLNPHIMDYCFNARCGWLRYSPMMILPFLGIPLLLIRRIQMVLLPIMILVAFYVVVSWDIWDYGGTAGRAMVQYYPLLAFPFSALLEFISKKKIYRIILSIVILLFTYANFWWFYHAHYGQIQVYNVSLAYWKHTVGRWRTEARSILLIDNRDVYLKEVKNASVIWRGVINSNDSLNPNMLRLDTTNKQSTLATIENKQNIKKWIRANLKVESSFIEPDIWKHNQLFFKYFKNGTEIKSNMIRLHRILNDHEIKNVPLDSRPPKEWDYLSLEIMNFGSIYPMYVHEVEIISFDE